jgi:secreted trypsin-like serine protease
VRLGCHANSPTACPSYEIKSFKVHEEYQYVDDEKTGAGVPLNDIAILRTEEPIEFTEQIGFGSIGPIGLPKMDQPDYFYNDTLTAAGWGLTIPRHSYDVLMKVDLRPIPLEQCRQNYTFVDEWTLCAGTPGKGPCHGDSGGPLFKTDNGSQRLVGIVSYGLGCARECGGVYTRVFAHLDWIDKWRSDERW